MNKPMQCATATRLLRFRLAVQVRYGLFELKFERGVRLLVERYVLTRSKIRFSRGPHECHHRQFDAVCLNRMCSSRVLGKLMVS